MATKKEDNMINFFSDFIIPAYDKLLPNSVFEYTFGEEIRKNSFIDKPELNNFNYKLNNYGHRSDDFKINHSGKHVLFAGCSTTFGEALPYMQNWSGKLYKKLSLKYKLDNYFCLGFLNGFTSHIIYNIMLYCEEFGSPEIIFCLFPESERTAKYKDKNLVIYYEKTKEYKTIGQLDCFKSILFLEKYCELKNIKLLWTTWDNEDLLFYKNKKFNNFLFVEPSDIKLMSNNKNEKNDPFYNIGRDNAHPGLWYSDGLANIFLKEMESRYVL